MKKKTFIDYTSRLKILKEYINYTFTVKLEDFTQGFCSLFLDWLMTTKKVGSRTRNNYRTWLSAFCSWLLERGYIPEGTESFHQRTDKQEPSRRESLFSFVAFLSVRSVCLLPSVH